MNVKDNKRQAAKTLFMQGFDQTEIAKILEVSLNTTTKWKQAEGWTEQRLQKELHDNTNADIVRELISYQLAVLKSKKDAELLLSAENRKLIERGDIDALQKLYTTIKRDEIKFEIFVSVAKRILAFVAEENIDLAKKVEPTFNRFINEARKSLA